MSNAELPAGSFFVDKRRNEHPENWDDRANTTPKTALAATGTAVSETSFGIASL